LFHGVSIEFFIEKSVWQKTVPAGPEEAPQAIVLKYLKIQDCETTKNMRGKNKTKQYTGNTTIKISHEEMVWNPSINS
jgi:hypothetical protein